MISANKTHDISRVYHQPQHIPDSAPDADGQKPSPVMPVDRVTLSKYALETPNQRHVAKAGTGNRELTSEQQEVVRDLKQRDAEVKAHEQAHIAAGSGVTKGGATYQYQTGPDGRMYAVEGEVQIDLSSAGSPEATIRKMQQIQAAALAPAQPSGADRAVAAQASQIEAMARLEKTEQKEKEEAESAASDRSLIEPAGPVDAPVFSETPGANIDVMA